MGMNGHGGAASDLKECTSSNGGDSGGDYGDVHLSEQVVEYTCKEDDSVRTIAHELGMPYDELIRLNAACWPSLRVSARLRRGAKILVPSKTDLQTSCMSSTSQVLTSLTSSLGGTPCSSPPLMAVVVVLAFASARI